MSRLAHATIAISVLVIVLVLGYTLWKAPQSQQDGARGVSTPTVVVTTPTVVPTPPGAPPVVVAPASENVPIPSSDFPLPIPSFDAPTSLPEAEHGLFLLTNEDRRLSGVAPLRRTASMDVLAHIRSAQLVASGNWSHCVGNPEVDVSVCPRTGKAIAALVLPGTGWAENLAWIGKSDPGDVPVAFNNGFLDSEPHHAALVAAKYTRIGVAVTCCTAGGVYLVAVEELGD